jgi:hypothetical protein
VFEANIVGWIRSPETEHAARAIQKTPVGRPLHLTRSNISAYLKLCKSTPERSCLQLPFVRPTQKVSNDTIYGSVLYLEVAEAAQVSVAVDRFLRVGPPEYVHLGLLHHREKLRVVVRPPHVPHVLPLKVRHVAACRALRKRRAFMEGFIERDGEGQEISRDLSGFLTFIFVLVDTRKQLSLKV